MSTRTEAARAVTAGPGEGSAGSAAAAGSVGSVGSVGRRSGGCGPRRRAVLAALPGVVLLPGVLSACGSGGVGGTDDGGTEQRATTVPSASFPAAEIPVGHAKRVKAGGQYVILAQPTAGHFVGFSAICTHRGGTVDVTHDLELRCPVHQAEFDAATGKVTGPPAKRPLDTVPVRVEGQNVVVG